jgi:hypothetical protein
MRPEDDFTGTEDALELLGYQTHKIRVIALMVVSVTAVNLVLSILVIFVAVLFESVRFDSRLQFSLIGPPIVLLISALGTLYLYDQRRGYANALFEEISDELEWRLKAVAKDEETTPSHEISRESPRLRARIILREFVLTTDLPFGHGREGAGFYVITNVLVSLMAALSVLLVGGARSGF